MTPPFGWVIRLAACPQNAFALVERILCRGGGPATSSQLEVLVTTRTSNVKVVEWSVALKVRSFSDVLVFQFTSTGTLVKQGQVVRQISQWLQRALREDVRVGTVLQKVVFAQEQLHEATYCEKHQTWCLELAFGLKKVRA